MLANTLRNMQSTRDVGHLFAALGYQPVDIPFDDGAQIVARWHGFKVIAMATGYPVERVRAMARRLGARGARAVAIGLSPRKQLALAAPRIGATGITPILVVSLIAPTREALHQLERLRPAGSATGLSHALRVTELLTSESVGQRFFTVFRMTLESMAGCLDRRYGIADRRLVSLLALTRVLFLYFVQTKGWLDGRGDYLRWLLDAVLSHGRSFHRTALEPLFFGTLNRPHGRRSTSAELGAIPYLNGGLFEPHPVERRLGMPRFANAVWRSVFDELFERFRFCVREAHEVDAIAPDMLGRVFERLMDVDERRASGTFYTPESVVRRLVEATIETALAGVGHLAPAMISRIFEHAPLTRAEQRRARARVRALRILDPAVGSGAFLLSALEILTDIRASLAARRVTPRLRQRIRREVLRENLFGVDLNPMAVRLAELRLWLAVVADDPTEDPGAVSPLPNLDGMVRQGDTLFDPVGTARAYQTGLSNGRATTALRRIRGARERLFGASDQSVADVTAQLRAAETELARTLIEDALRGTQRALTDLSTVATSRDLFGRRARLTPPQQLRFRALRRHRTELQRARDAVDDGRLPFFSFEVHTPDILAGGGFSAVVGNPPWVRAERLAPAKRRALRERFTWWRGTRGRGYSHLPDLSVAFLQRALELTAPGGAVGLLLPAKLTTATYGETARRHLVRETTVTYAHRVPQREAALFGATTYPLALVLRNNPPARDHALHLGFDRTHAVEQRTLVRTGPWLLIPEREHRALDELLSSGVPLAEITQPALGVKTGADRCLVGELLEIADDVGVVRFPESKAVLELRAVRPAVRGRDVRRFAARASRVVVWGYDQDGNTLERLPARTAAYLQSYSAALRRRADYRSGPPWTLFRTRAALASHRVVWPDLARQPRALVLDETDLGCAIPLNTCYVAAAPDRGCALTIAAVLNSTWAWAIAAALADEARGRYRRINARVTAQIPIPRPGAARTALSHLSAVAHSGQVVSQDALDDAVAKALALTDSTQKALRELAANLSGATSPRSRTTALDPASG